jgi:site-specific recombinase XerD
MSFGKWMVAHRGVTSSTVGVYQRALAGIVKDLGEDPRSYTAAALRAFVVEYAKRRGNTASKAVVGALRAYLRYLVAEGRCTAGLERAVPTVVRWRLSSLPRYIDLETVERVIAASKGHTPQGLRDHAVLLLLARLGLRAGDVAGLCFDDVDWDKASIRVDGKGRRETRLPLPQDVGDALAAYIERGRVAHEDSRIFLRVRAPYRPLSTYSAISDIVRSAIRRAGVDAPIKGAHLLRHSFATTLLRSGGTLDTVGSVLRHQSPQTTLIYAKVDFSSLSTIAQPWPESTSC